MVRVHRDLDDGCWLDIYEGPWFSGKVRRLQGPGTFHDPQGNGRPPGSVIVGPNATVSRADRPGVVALKPKQIVPEAAKQPLAAKLKSFQLRAAELK